MIRNISLSMTRCKERDTKNLTKKAISSISQTNILTNSRNSLISTKNLLQIRGGVFGIGSFELAKFLFKEVKKRFDKLQTTYCKISKDYEKEQKEQNGKWFQLPSLDDFPLGKVGIFLVAVIVYLTHREVPKGFEIIEKTIKSVFPFKKKTMTEWTREKLQTSLDFLFLNKQFYSLNLNSFQLFYHKFLNK